MIFDFSPYYQLDLTKPPYKFHGVSILLMGDRGAGKSTFEAVAFEEAHRLRLPAMFFDINGDACSLRELGDDVMVVGRERHPEEIRRAHFNLEDAMDRPKKFINYALGDHYKLIFDLSGRPLDTRIEAVAILAEKLYELSEEYRYPCLVAVDEAHVFAPQGRSTKIQQRSLSALDMIISDGRKRGLLAFLATQRPQRLNKDLSSQCSDRLIGKIVEEKTFKYLRNYIPPSYRWSHLRSFRPGQYILFNHEGYSEIQVRPRRTTDLGVTPIPFGEAKNPSVKNLFMMPTFTAMSVPQERD